MKKKLLSLALALAICFSLAVPAAYAAYYDLSQNGEVLEGKSGDGWSLSYGSVDVLTLSGVQNLSIRMDGDCIIELAPGTKSTLVAPLFVEEWLNDKQPVLTFRGTGELEIISSYDYTTPNELGPWAGAITGSFSEIKLEDGLVMTGGAKQGDNFPLTLGPKYDMGKDGWELCAGETADHWYYLRGCVANGTPAKYVHIGPAAPSATPFTDVAATSPFVDAINWAVKEGITNGTSPTTFGPGNTCTVSHILTFLYRAAGSPNKGSDERASVVAWANSKGLDTPDLGSPCTRAAAVSYMWKAAGSPKPTKSASFADVSASASYAQAVSWAVEKGITNGTGGNTFSPGGICTRGQIVTFLYRANK